MAVLILFACACNTEQPASTDIENGQNITIEKEPEQNKQPSNPVQPQPQMCSIELSKDNYKDYLEIVIAQSNQSSTFVKAQYRVKYKANGIVEDIWTTSTPNTSLYSSCKLMTTVYNITTTFNIFISNKSSVYSFSGTMVLFEYKTAFASVRVDDYGYGISSFTLTESMYNRQSYTYNLEIDNLIKNLVGVVYYYE